MNASSSNWMIFITYRIRDGADDDGYDDWLRRIDNPFFNAIPGVKRYTNWKVHDSRRPLPFTHFDFLEIDDVEELETVWFNPDLNAFRAEWVRLWGRGVPDPDNAHCCLCEADASTAPTANLVVFPGADGAPADATPWTTRELLHKHYALGPSDTWRTTDIGARAAQFARFAVQFTTAPQDAAAIAKTAPEAARAFSASLIAAPPWFTKDK